QAFSDIAEQPCEGPFANTDGGGIKHMTVWRVDGAFGDKRYNRSHQRVTEFSRDGFGGGAEDVVVLARGQIGTIHLNASRRNQDGGLAGAHGVAYFNPSELLQPQR